MVIPLRSDSPGNVYPLILAAGKGKRTGLSGRPKVLLPLGPQPLISYVLHSLEGAGFPRPIIVVGFLGRQVKQVLGPAYCYADQRKLSGTGQAVLAARKFLADQNGCTLILNGDHPFYQPTSLRRLVSAIRKKRATIAVLTGLLPAREFDSFGRVIADRRGRVIKIVEARDATPDERAVRLMNLGSYAVDNQWLWSALDHLPKSPVSGEFHLTGIVALAAEEGRVVLALPMAERREAIGINTLDDLARAEKILESRSS